MKNILLKSFVFMSLVGLNMAAEASLPVSGEAKEAATTEAKSGEKLQITPEVIIRALGKKASEHALEEFEHHMEKMDFNSAMNCIVPALMFLGVPIKRTADGSIAIQNVPELQLMLRLGQAMGHIEFVERMKEKMDKEKEEKEAEEEAADKRRKTELHHMMYC